MSVGKRVHDAVVAERDAALRANKNFATRERRHRYEMSIMRGEVAEAEAELKTLRASVQALDGLLHTAQAENVAMQEIIDARPHDYRCAGTYEVERNCESDLCRCNCFKSKLWMLHRCGFPDKRVLP